MLVIWAKLWSYDNLYGRYLRRWKFICTWVYTNIKINKWKWWTRQSQFKYCSKEIYEVCDRNRVVSHSCILIGKFKNIVWVGQFTDWLLREKHRRLKTKYASQSPGLRNKLIQMQMRGNKSKSWSHTRSHLSYHTISHNFRLYHISYHIIHLESKIGEIKIYKYVYKSPTLWIINIRPEKQRTSIILEINASLSVVQIDYF